VIGTARVFRQPWPAGQAWEFIEALLASPGLGILLPTDRHGAVAAEIFAGLPHLAGNVMHDAQTAALMREPGIRRIYTRDTDFHRFPFLEPIDPTS
jgi:predicted nucleic acid-binding protein